MSADKSSSTITLPNNPTPIDARLEIAVRASGAGPTVVQFSFVSGIGTHHGSARAETLSNAVCSVLAAAGPYFYAIGREAAGGDPLVFPTALITEHPVDGRLVHYFDAGAEALDCGYGMKKGYQVVGRVSSAAHVLGAMFHGGALCPQCRELHDASAQIATWQARLDDIRDRGEVLSPAVENVTMDAVKTGRHGPHLAAGELIGCTCGWRIDSTPPVLATHPADVQLSMHLLVCGADDASDVLKAELSANQVKVHARIVEAGHVVGCLCGWKANPHYTDDGKPLLPSTEEQYSDHLSSLADARKAAGVHHGR